MVFAGKCTVFIPDDCQKLLVKCELSCVHACSVPSGFSRFVYQICAIQKREFDYGCIQLIKVNLFCV